MLELGSNLDLAMKARRADGGREIIAQHLDRYLATVPHILGQIDGRHPASAELALDDVLAKQAGVDLCDAIGHATGAVGMRQDRCSRAKCDTGAPSARRLRSVMIFP